MSLWTFSLQITLQSVSSSVLYNTPLAGPTFRNTFPPLLYYFICIYFPRPVYSNMRHLFVIFSSLIYQSLFHLPPGIWWMEQSPARKVRWRWMKRVRRRRTRGYIWYLVSLKSWEKHEAKKTRKYMKDSKFERIKEFWMLHPISLQTPQKQARQPTPIKTPIKTEEDDEYGASTDVDEAGLEQQRALSKTCIAVLLKAQSVIALWNTVANHHWPCSDSDLLYWRNSLTELVILTVCNG